MASIADLLADDTVAWHEVEDRLELRHDGDVLARIDGHTVVMGDRRLELRDVRGQTTLHDIGRGARVATFRLVNHGTGRVGAITLPHTRIRVSKVAVNPFRYEVTEGLGGPQLLVATKVFGRTSIKAGRAFDPTMDAGVAALALALTLHPQFDRAAVVT